MASSVQDLRRAFAAADPRFGPVPLWWWSGEPVSEERVRWQMGKFREAGLRNLCVINLAPAGPIYNCAPDDPPFYSERWWDLFGCALDEAERLGMFLWFYDQIGFSAANFPARLVAENPAFTGYHLRRLDPGAPLPVGAEVLSREGGAVYAAVRQGFDWLNPRAAAALIDRIHGEMERRFGDRLGRVLAGSFQDELQPMPNWSADLPRLYRERYGEDLLARLPLLVEGGPGAPALRRAYHSLLADLAESAFFGPLGEWHARHGMLLGCDQAGPGREVDPHGAQRLYIDYFRTHRHLSAPGCDMDGEAKPHASLVHLHGGQRVWLEGFHSSGWGGTVEETLHWLVPWLQAGVTLFDPHAVYYSTRGGWWEWAPPDTGWRQPYAEHYPLFADLVARACWLLAQGSHLCDIAVYYPGQAIWEHMSPADIRPGEHPQAAAGRDPDAETAHIRAVYWELVGRQARHRAATGVLRGDRRDFDLVDDAAIAAGRARDGALHVAEEHYRVLILPGAVPADPAAREALDAFAAAGGLIVAVGLEDGIPLPAGAVRVGRPAEVPAALAAVERRADGGGLALARRVGEADVFLLLPPLADLLPMHAATTAAPALPAAVDFTLATEGRPELWNPVTGESRPLSFTRQGGRVRVSVPLADWPAALVVCVPEEEAVAAGASASGTPAGSSAGTPAMEGAPGRWPLPARPAPPAVPGATVRTLPADGWRVRVVQTLDNRFGDFDLHGPAEGGGVPEVERRRFRVRTEGDGEGEAAGWHLPALDDADWPERLWSEAARWRTRRGERWDPEGAEPAVYSTRFGDLAFRDWAGRMGRVPRAFLPLGRLARGETVWACTHVVVPAPGAYWLQVEGPAAKAAWIDGRPVALSEGGDMYAARVELDLVPGPHELRLRVEAAHDGRLALAVQLTAARPEPLPEWLAASPAADGTAPALRAVVRTEAAPRRAHVHFAAHGHVQLWVNGRLVAVQGDFNPYERNGQEAVDLTAGWTRGANEVELRFPEGRGDERAFLDGEVVGAEGQRQGWATGPGWVDGAGRPANRPPHAGSTEALWIRPRPHPLADIGWLMPDSVPSPEPLPFVIDPEQARRPVWLRFPLPAGARELRLTALGAARAWIDGREVAVRDGAASFPAGAPGALCAIRVVPSAPTPEAAVLAAPVRFRTVPSSGSLGDWRRTLHLPHHSGAVEYAREVEGRGPDAWLDLGYVRGTAEVWVDGVQAGARLWHPYRFDLRGLWGAGSHRLRVRVTNTLGAHYEEGRPTSLVAGGQGAGGLFGPVALWERDGGVPG